MTGYDIPGVAEEALGPVLRKPVEEEQLVAEIRRVLDVDGRRSPTGGADKSRNAATRFSSRNHLPS